MCVGRWVFVCLCMNAYVCALVCVCARTLGVCVCVCVCVSVCVRPAGSYVAFHRQSARNLFSIALLNVSHSLCVAVQGDLSPACLV